jgi:thioesterase domain-containing protein
VREAGYRAFQRYTPHVYDGPVVYFQAGTPTLYPANPRKTWQQYLPHMMIHTLPGDHFSIIRAHLENSARLLSASIEAGAPVRDNPVRSVGHETERQVA